MINQQSEPSRKEVQKFMVQLAETAILLLNEEPIRITEFEDGKEHKLGISHEVYTAAVPMKNAISCLFATMADSLIYTDDRTPRLLVHENGNIDPLVMSAISFRYVTNMDFPEFSVPLGEALKKAAKTHSLTNGLWKLVEGEGKTLYFQAIGEKPPMRANSLRKRATVVRLFDDESS